MFDTKAQPNVSIWLANQQEAKNIVEAWEKINQAFHQTMEQEIKSCFFSIRVKMMIKTLQHLHQDHRLARHDAELFPHLEQWMQQYSQIIEIYEEIQKEEEDPQNTEIIQGIISVLRSQYQQFYEDGPKGINPILLEKEKYISHTKQMLVAGLGKIEKEFIKDIKKDPKNTKGYQKQWMQQGNIKEIYQKQVEQWYQSIWNRKNLEIYKLYHTVTLAGMQQIDYFNKRPMLHLYYEFAQNQKNTLELICTLQLDNTDQNDLLNNLYTQIKEKTKDWEQGFKNGVELEQRIANQASFDQYIQEDGIGRYIKDIQGMTEERMAEQWHEFYETVAFFKTSWDVLIQQYEAFFTRWIKTEKNKWIKTIGKQADRYQQMVEQIVTSFQEFQRSYQEQAERLLTTEYKDIFTGIEETLSIKIQSIQEQQEEWMQDIKKICEKSPTIHREIIGTPPSLYEQWIQSESVYTEDKSMLISILGQLFANDWETGENKKVEGQWIQWIENQEQQWEKAVKNQLRNNLLFEISTFEEILYYSISRIRDEEDEAIIQYVKGMDDLTQKLYDALETYDITFIKPKPYEKFDGKEQEVLLAEEQEGFQKGDIIKCINTGYRYQGQVLLRANVIAAR